MLQLQKKVEEEGRENLRTLADFGSADFDSWSNRVITICGWFGWILKSKTSFPRLVEVSEEVSLSFVFRFSLPIAVPLQSKDTIQCQCA